MARRYWLFKSDPDTYGLPHLKKERGKQAMWDGVRNFQARNLLRDQVQLGDGVLFYHSQVKPPAVVALAEVIKTGYPDPTQHDPKEKYFDAKSDPGDPRWYAVDIKLTEELKTPVTLPEIKETPGLQEMVLVKRSRLSIQPVTPAEWKIVVKLGRSRARGG